VTSALSQQNSSVLLVSQDSLKQVAHACALGVLVEPKHGILLKVLVQILYAILKNAFQKWDVENMKGKTFPFLQVFTYLASEQGSR
jgi:hypothetical protein